MEQKTLQREIVDFLYPEKKIEFVPVKGDKGEKGIQGERGEKGDKGDSGIQGIQGIKGERGLQGFQGEDGLQGEKGDQGEQGVQGVQGEKGKQGEKGLQGSSDTGKEIINKINELPLEDEFKIDASHIKNLRSLLRGLGNLGLHQVGYSFSDNEIPSQVPNGVITDFTTVNIPSTNSLKVFRNGVLQSEGATEDYTFSGTTVIFTTAPKIGNKIRFDYRY